MLTIDRIFSLKLEQSNCLIKQLFNIVIQIRAISLFNEKSNDHV